MVVPVGKRKRVIADMADKTYTKYLVCTSEGEPLGIDMNSGGYPWRPMQYGVNPSNWRWANSHEERKDQYQSYFSYLPGDGKQHTVRVTITIHMDDIV